MNFRGIETLDELIRLASFSEITDEMRKHFDERTDMHINLVQKYCKKIADIFGDDFEGIIERGKEHDASKKKEPELEPYIFLTWDYKLKREGNENGAEFSQEIEDIMNEATNLHVQTNNHHPEFHCPKKKRNMINRKNRDGIPEEMIDATKMPILDIGELCADWCAMSEEKGTNTPQEWADMNIDKRWKFKDEQKKMIYEILNKIWD